MCNQTLAQEGLDVHLQYTNAFNLNEYDVVFWGEILLFNIKCLNRYTRHKLRTRSRIIPTQSNQSNIIW